MHKSLRFATLQMQQHLCNCKEHLLKEPNQNVAYPSTLEELSAEWFTTATGLHRIGVNELKAAANQGIAIIERQTVEVK